MPNLPLGSTRDQVLAELQRVNSRLITDQEKYVGNDNYIQALVQTSLTDNATNNKPVTMRMEFYLEHQRLSSQKITSLSFAP